jgi:hypothetical protein
MYQRNVRPKRYWEHQEPMLLGVRLKERLQEESGTFDLYLHTILSILQSGRANLKRSSNRSALQSGSSSLHKIDHDYFENFVAPCRGRPPASLFDRSESPHPPSRASSHGPARSQFRASAAPTMLGVVSTRPRRPRGNYSILFRGKSGTVAT